MKKKWDKTIAVDFDGVLHCNDEPFEDPGIIRGQPHDGAYWFFANALLNGYRVVIVSARANQRRGRRAIRRWMTKHFPEYAKKIQVTCKKVPAVVYIDDRAARFSGMFYSSEYYASMAPWNRVQAPVESHE